MFQGFTEETQDFLWGITLNNSREWFEPHKQIYINSLYTPLKELAFAVQERFLEKHPNQPLNCKVTRIYRDARIPHPDGIYKTNLWFSLEAPVDRDLNPVVPKLFFEIEGAGYAVGMDFYCDRPAVMASFREKVLEEPKPLEKLTRKMKKRPEYQIEGPEYKRSKGEVGTLISPWFNRKRICVLAQHDWDSILSSEELIDHIVNEFEWLFPFYQYFSNIS